jgi:hypothetical protein
MVVAGFCVVKVVHDSSGEVITVQASKGIPSDNREINCECCIKMKVELSEVKLELSSCKEIIRILQEEIREISSYYQPTGNKVNVDSKNRESYNPLTKEEWTSLSSNRSRYPRYSRRNL